MKKVMHLQNNSPKQALRARQTETDRRRFSSIRRVGFLKRLVQEGTLEESLRATHWRNLAN